MTDEEARALCAAAQMGDDVARCQLTEAHLRLIHLVAFDWVRAYKGAAKNYSIGTRDLEQTAAEIMLAEVIPTYHVDGPVPFRSYARRKMNAGLWRELKFHIRQTDLIDRATPFLREQYIENATPPDPADVYAHNQVHIVIDGIIATAIVEETLTPSQAEVIELSARGLSRKEIASVISISPKRVSYLLSGAREALRSGFYDHE